MRRPSHEADSTVHVEQCRRDLLHDRLEKSRELNEPHVELRIQDEHPPDQVLAEGQRQRHHPAEWMGRRKAVGDLALDELDRAAARIESNDFGSVFVRAGPSPPFDDQDPVWRPKQVLSWLSGAECSAPAGGNTAHPRAESQQEQPTAPQILQHDHELRRMHQRGDFARRVAQPARDARVHADVSEERVDGGGLRAQAASLVREKREEHSDEREVQSLRNITL